MRLARRPESHAGGESRPAASASTAVQREVEPLVHQVLIIEDNVDAAESLREYLELCGHQVRVAHSGTEGVALATERPPTLVLCDIGLPGMDGWAVARALRSTPGTAQTRLVAITGYGSKDDQRRSAESGFEAHLTKPIDMAALDALLNRGA